MRVESAEQKVLHYEREIRNHIYDSFVWKHIEEPIIDKDKIAVLLAILSHADVKEQQLSNYILSIMLMQIALDTHENVTNELNSEDAHELRKRQLTILAGDYYSGLYYHILSKTMDIHFIREFSQGIQVVNESKVELYRSKEATAEFLLTHFKAIEATLAEKVSNYFGSSCDLSFFKDFLLLKRVNREFTLHDSVNRGLETKPGYDAVILMSPFLNEVEDLQGGVERGLGVLTCEDMAHRVRRALAESREHINNMMGKGLFK